MQRTTPHHHRSRVSRAFGAAALAGLVTLAAACGSDDDVSVGDDEITVPEDLGDVTIPEDLGDVTVPEELSDVTIPEDLGDVTIPEDLSDLTIPEDLSDITIPEDFTDLTIPAGMNEECTDLYTKFAGLFGSMISGQDGAAEQVDEAIADLRDQVPEDLQDDVDVLDEAYGSIADLLEGYDGDLAQLATDPEAQERIAALDSEEVSSASDAVSGYLEESCGVEG